MEISALPRSFDITSTNGPIAKALTLLPFLRIPRNHRLHDIQNLILLDAATVQLVQALPVISTAKVQIVSAVGLANERGLGQPRPRATVGAARHAEHDAVVAQAGVLERALQLRDQLGEVALGLGHGQAAGREGHARRRAEAQPGEVGVVEPEAREVSLDLRYAVVRHVAENEMLVAGQSELADIQLGEHTQARLHLELGRIFDAAVLDEEAEVVQA